MKRSVRGHPRGSLLDQGGISIILDGRGREERKHYSLGFTITGCRSYTFSKETNEFPHDSYNDMGMLLIKC
jgi:hypothetical protein